MYAARKNFEFCNMLLVAKYALRKNLEKTHIRKIRAKNVSNFIDFQTLQNSLNRAPVYIKHRFSPFGPAPKMASKVPPKTSLLDTFGLQNRPKCRKWERMKIHSKMRLPKHRKCAKLTSKIVSTLARKHSCFPLRFQTCLQRGPRLPKYVFLRKHTFF